MFKLKININLNGENISREIEADMTLYTLLRNENCHSVKCGCESSNCGACTVLLDDEPVLSCSLFAARADGRKVTTLEGLKETAEKIAPFIASQGADQCGFCNPGYIVNTISLLKKNSNPDEDEIKEYLAGNLCRCSGYLGQQRGIMEYVKWANSRIKEEEDV